MRADLLRCAVIFCLRASPLGDLAMAHGSQSQPADDGRWTMPGKNHAGTQLSGLNQARGHERLRGRSEGRTRFMALWGLIFSGSFLAAFLFFLDYMYMAPLCGR